jgi:hypothetical protein
VRSESRLRRFETTARPGPGGTEEETKPAGPAAVPSAGHPFPQMSMMPAGEAQMYGLFGPPHGPSLANFGEHLFSRHFGE